MKSALLCTLVLNLGLPLEMGAQEEMTVHELKATAETTHISFFDASLEPVLSINSGDFVKLETASVSPGYLQSQGVEKERIPPELFAAYEGRDFAERGDHTLSGPIFVNGAEPGDMLEIRIISVDLRLPVAGQGINPNLFPDLFPNPTQRVHWLDLEQRTVEFAPGVVVPLKPFWGVIGVAPPPEMGRVGSSAPNFFGGNMDNRDLVSGSILYLPVHNQGALLSIGDGHGAQGYGEVSGSAIETSLKGEIQVILHKGRELQWPQAETSTHYITMGLHEDLDEAAKIAMMEMIDYLVTVRGLDRDTALLLASVAMDMVVTQVVDGTKGIHAMIPKGIFDN